MSHVKSDSSIADSEAAEEPSINEMTMDVVDLENGLRGKDFSDTFMVRCHFYSGIFKNRIK